MESTSLATVLLDKVQAQVMTELGTEIAPKKADSIKDVILKRIAFCEDMVKRCEVAEQKMDGDSAVLLRSLTLKAQLYANLQKPGNGREAQEKMLACYEQALKVVKDPAAEAELRYRYALACRDASAVAGITKEQVTENLQKALSLAGVNSELALACAKELGIDPSAARQLQAAAAAGGEKPAEQEPKKGGCFIATACYGSYDAPDVMVLRQFRDDVMLQSRIGKGLVSLYYTVSPPVADFIAARAGLKKLVREIFIAPAVKHARRMMDKQ